MIQGSVATNASWPPRPIQPGAACSAAISIAIFKLSGSLCRMRSGMTVSPSLGSPLFFWGGGALGPRAIFLRKLRSPAGEGG
jgi:hypothetical protein